MRTSHVVGLTVAALVALAAVGLWVWAGREPHAAGVNTSGLSREAVPGYVAALKDQDPAARAKAADSLWKIGTYAKEATPALVAALADPDPAVRAAAARALGPASLGTRDAVPGLTAALKDDQAPVRAAAANALAEVWLEERHGPPPVGQGVARPTVDPPPEAKELHRAAVPALTVLLRDPDAKVRGRAAAALVEIAPLAGPALPDLVGVLGKDADADARLQSTLVMAGLGPAAGAGTEALAGRVRADPDVGVRLNAARALGLIKARPEAAVPALIEAYLTDPEGQVRGVCSWALGQYGPEARRAEARARAAADPAGTEPQEVRQRAARFLELLEKKLPADGAGKP
ncbi:MAG: HEAT repeat domain-containing protein [Gemmataceae bacterium]|nr:HEAT repeat domain-containing protein [Gemmataceae bacterium]